MAGIGQWEPAQGAHAIQLAAVGINFREPITSYLVDQVVQKVTPAANELGLVEHVPIQDGMFVMVQGNMAPPPVQTAGCEFLKRERPDFFSDKLTLNKSQIRFEDWSYTRWAVTLEKISRLVEPVLATYSSSSLIADIYVEYIDVFSAPGGASDSPFLVVSENSPFIARGAAAAQTLWHTHSGYFEFPEPVGRRLQQVNVDCGEGNAPDGSARRIIQIRTMASDQANDPSHPPSDHLNTPWEAVAQRLQILHDCAKGNFREILTAEAALAVSLG